MSYLMRGPDPYSSYESAYDPNQGVWYDYEDSFSWGDFAQDALNQAARTAQIIGAGYPPLPPGSTITYSPQIGQQSPPYVTLPSGQSVTPQPAPVGGAGIQLSTTTLMLIAGAFLLFSLGKSRGR